MTTDHSDWFGADGDAPDAPSDASAAGFDPEVADWFDDIEHVDPMPEEAPWTGSPPSAGADATASADAGAGGAGGGGEATGATGTDSNDRTGESGPGGQGAAGTDRETAAAGAGGESPQPAAGTRSGRRSQQDDSSGGFIAWLKRLLGLN